MSDTSTWAFTPLPLDPDLDIAIVGLDRAATLATEADHLVSIWDSEANALPDWLHEHPSPLVLRFDDVQSDGPGAVSGDALLPLLGLAPALSGRVLVHCRHGINRSAAVALVLLAARMGPGRESEAVVATRAAERQTTERGWRADETHPNARVVWEADLLLERQGRLWEEFLRSWGDFAGVVFS